MKEIGIEAERDGFSHILPFNTTYSIITTNVIAKMGKGYFDDDVRMNTLDVVFGRYYFQALKQYVDKKDCPPAWETLFTAHENNHFAFVHMALGVNAHVNNDLPLTLYEVDPQDAYRKDYDLVNTIIDQSIEEVVNSFSEQQRYLEITKNNSKLYYGFLSLLIQKWRIGAWDNYQKLKLGSTSQKEIEQKAHNISQKLIGVERIHDIPKLLLLLS
jgi:hypothetical protein